MRHYMYMVMKMVAFIRAVRIRDWSLHLIALEMFTKYFFVHDRINNALMIYVRVYLAEMSSLNEGDPEIHEELTLGNWLVNKNAQVLFCPAGADNALKHKECSMKVSGGLVGITLNKTVMTKLFSDSSRARRLAEQAKKIRKGVGGQGVFQDSMSSSQPHNGCLGTQRERCSTVNSHYWKVHESILWRTYWPVQPCKQGCYARNSKERFG